MFDKPQAEGFGFYSIDGLCPSGGLGGYGFCIHLSPLFRDAVQKSGLDQAQADRVISAYGREWLSHTGMGSHFDIENCTAWSDNRKIPSEQFRDRNHREIRVAWGEWGPEHISVPGNACGLDIDKPFSVFRDGRVLTPAQHRPLGPGQPVVDRVLLVRTQHHVGR